MDEGRRMFGEDYPRSIVLFGKVRMNLKKESRFSRFYSTPDGKQGTEISRFQDGSATVTADRLVAEWPEMSAKERQDFCGACSWLGRQEDFPDMLRFILQNGDANHWSAIAGCVANRLPRDEAFQRLGRCLLSGDCIPSSNITQALALTRHPDAIELLCSHLDLLWTKADLWDDDAFQNWTAFDAVNCIKHLIELGASPVQFESQAKSLSDHACEGTRQTCGLWLSKSYDWLKKPPLPDFPGFDGES